MSEPAEVVPAGARQAERVAWIFAAWVLSRVLLILLSRARGWYAYQDDPFDLALFPEWGKAFATGQGHVPLRDGPWEYPAGAALVFVPPALLAGVAYQLGFVGLMLVADLLLLLTLTQWGLRRGRLGGAWLWCAVVPLLGPVALTRYDVVPTLTAVAGIAVAGAAPVAAGALLALGGSLKLWPLLLLPLAALLLPSWRRMLLGAAAFTAVLVGVAAVYGYTGQLLSFLSYQRDRGLEVESLPAVPLLLDRLRGDRAAHVFFGFGSYEVDGPHAALLGALGTVGLGAVFVAVAALAWRARRAARPGLDQLLCLAALLVAGLLCFDKVLSAQYPLWLAGLICLGLCTRGRTLLPTVPLLCLVLLTTQLVYPLLIQDLVGGRTRGLVVLGVRDLALVGLTGQLLWLTLRVTARTARNADAAAAGSKEMAGV